MVQAAGPAIPVHGFETLDSTNAEALRRLANGDNAMQLIHAREQTAGRGRAGNRWTSPPGNLYATFVTPRPDGRLVGELAFVTALAAGDAILACCAALTDLRYKWPNDVLSGGRKLAGVLIESDGRNGVATGVGINVESAPAGTAWPATCLRAAGCAAATVDGLRDALTDAFCARFAAWAEDGFDAIRDAWLARAHGIGTPMRARLPDGAIYDGVFAALDADGALLLDQGAAGTRRIAAGEIVAGAA